MPWFKVDDHFWSHPKTADLSPGATALWLRAGSWAAGHLTDGFVPKTMLRTFRARRAWADELVAKLLWTDEQTSWKFHEWDTYQPTKVAVEARRSATKNRVNAWRQGAGNSVTGTFGERVSNAAPDPTRPDPTINSPREVSSGGTTGPWCARHQGGTDDPCGACRTARIAFEASERKDVEAKRDRTPHTRAPRRGDGHECSDDGNGWCRTCVERMP